MTASRTRRSRFESSSTRLISSNLVTTSARSQVCGQTVQTQPAKRGQPNDIVFDRCPARFRPRHHLLRDFSGESDACFSAETKVGLFSELRRRIQIFKA